MKSEIIIQLHKNFEDYANQIDDEEFWLARDMMGLLGYTKWENFSNVIDKAKIACQTSGHTIADHFPDVRKTIPMPKGAEKEIDDINIKRDDLRHEAAIAQEHVKNNLDVRRVLTNRGISPEALPPAEDIKKLERRVKSEEKQITKKVAKRKRIT
jgi:hypothetical protein